MRSGAAAGTSGCFHEAAFYGSDEEFLAVVGPFLRDGLAAGEPTLAALSEHNTALVRSVLPAASAITFLPADLQYVRPAGTIRAYRDVLATHVARGAPQIRVVGEVPQPGHGAGWDGWARYEAAVNTAYDTYPVWGLCPYDTRSTAPHVLGDVARTHPYLATADGGHRPNPDYGDPHRFLTEQTLGRPLPETAAPAWDVADPAAVAVRRLVRDVARAAGLGGEQVDDLVLAASEAVDNAHVHGHPPVRLRIWPGRGRVTVAVTDAGAGPRDPHAGLVPTTDSATAGLGLWMAHQLCREVTLHRDADGFTIRMVVGA